jgi:hypothetical protein
MLFRPTSLLQHPFPDVSRTVQDRDTCRLTRIEETNTFEIDQIQFFQIQNDWRLAALDFGFDLIQVPKSKFAAEPNPPFEPFNPQRHLLIGSGTYLTEHEMGQFQSLALTGLTWKCGPDFSGIPLC